MTEGFLVLHHWQAPNEPVTIRVTYAARIYLHALALASDKEQLLNKAFKTNAFRLLGKPFVSTCVILKLIKCTP